MFEKFDVKAALAALRDDGDLKYAAAFEPELAAQLAAGNGYFTAVQIAATRASEGDGGSNDATTARYAALDAERNERDRQARRGYDYNESAPSHAEYLRRKD